MTIRNNNSNDKSFASQAPTEETDDAVVAFNVNAVDVFNEDNIPFAHASSEVELSSISGGGLSTSTTAANSGLYGQLNTTTNAVAAPTTPIAYSTGKPPQPPPPSQQPPPPPQPRFSSSIAVTTGAPIPTPTSTTQITSTSTATTTTRGNSRRNNNNSQNCCSGLTCCGITAIVLSSIFVCCIVPTILIFWAIGSAVNNGATIGSF